MKRLILYIILIIFSSCQPNLDDVAKLFAEKNEDLEVVEDVKLIYSDSGKVLLILEADSMVINNTSTNQEEEFPNGLKADFYDSKQNKISTLISKYAVRKKDQDKVIARNDVILFNDKGDTLRTEELIWNEKTRNLNSTQFVKITTPKEVIYGFGFTTNENFTRYEIYNISGRTAIDELAQEFD